MRTTIIIALLCFISSFTYSQKPPIKYGKISIEELEMTVYDKDTTAPAVVLCDYGTFDAEEFQFTRNIRIKILSKDGYRFANQFFQTWEKTNIKGATYNLVDNEIIKTKLENNAIYRERITESFIIMNVAMPNVSVGSIIELKFSFYGYPLEWYFQREIPVAWSELRLEPTEFVKFDKNFIGFEPLHINSEYRWVSKDMPAFKKESFMNSVENYITKFEFDIKSIGFPGIWFNEYCSSWEVASNYLLEHNNFGRIISNPINLNSIAKSIKNNCSTNIEMLKAAHDSVKNIRWNERERLYSSFANSKTAYKKQLGNSSDINLALLQLLLKLDFNAKPVVLSTRKNGILSYNNPSIRKLNYVIIQLVADEDTILLDATEQLLPYTLLPTRCLNWHGQTIDYNHSESVDLSTEQKEVKTVQYSLTLEKDMRFKGQANYLNNNYSAFNSRKNLMRFNSETEYLEDYLKDKEGVEIVNYSSTNRDSIYLPFKEKFEIEIKNNVEILDGEAYFYPLFFDALKENPFKLEERKYPVDFVMKKTKTVICTIQLPDNTEIASLPKNANYKLAGNGAQFIYSISQAGKSIQVMYKFKINKQVFTSEEYHDLKEFYNQIIIKHKEPVVLKIKNS